MCLNKSIRFNLNIVSLVITLIAARKYIKAFGIRHMDMSNLRQRYLGQHI